MVFYALCEYNITPSINIYFAFSSPLFYNESILRTFIIYSMYTNMYNMYVYLRGGSLWNQWSNVLYAIQA